MGHLDEFVKLFFGKADNHLFTFTNLKTKQKIQCRPRLFGWFCCWLLLVPWWYHTILIQNKEIWILLI